MLAWQCVLKVSVSQGFGCLTLTALVEAVGGWNVWPNRPTAGEPQVRLHPDVTGGSTYFLSYREAAGYDSGLKQQYRCAGLAGAAASGLGT
jgi:hypothetical protein